jgi:hypothetical protein
MKIRKTVMRLVLTAALSLLAAVSLAGMAGWIRTGPPLVRVAGRLWPAEAAEEPRLAAGQPGQPRLAAE